MNRSWESCSTFFMVLEAQVNRGFKVHWFLRLLQKCISILSGVFFHASNFEFRFWLMTDDIWLYDLMSNVNFYNWPYKTVCNLRESIFGIMKSQQYHVKDSICNSFLLGFKKYIYIIYIDIKFQSVKGGTGFESFLLLLVGSPVSATDEA